MTSTSKLRVAVADAPMAVHTLRTEVARLTGLEVVPELQEIEGNHLVVELRVVGKGDADACDLAASVRQSACDLDVLSAWAEVPGAVTPGGPVFSTPGRDMPGAGERALREGLPTAAWVPSADRSERADPAHWILAVPAVPAGRVPMVAVRRRSGYSARFSTGDVASLRSGLRTGPAGWFPAWNSTPAAVEPTR